MKITVADCLELSSKNSKVTNGCDRLFFETAKGWRGLETMIEQ